MQQPDRRSFARLLTAALILVAASAASAVDSSAAPTSEPNLEPAVDWNALIPESDPDVTGAPEPEAWSEFQYLFVSGVATSPRSNLPSWLYAGAGCVSVMNAPSEIFNFHVDLPAGSRIDYVRIYYYDTVAQAGSGFLTSYDGAGGFTDMVYLSTEGSAGYATTLSAYSGAIVDNLSQSYLLNWRPNAVGNGMRLCGFRIAYRLPV